MQSLVTAIYWLLSDTTVLILLVQLASIVVAGMSVYGMILAMKSRKNRK